MSSIFKRIPGKNYPVAVKGEGVWLFDSEGRRYLDGSGGACVVTIGHGVPEVAREVAAQMEKVSFVHGTQFVTEAAGELAGRIAELSSDPEADKVYLLSGGSEAVETAVKMARQYWRETGKPDRYKVVSRWTSYHGNTAGALALSGHTGRRKHYQPLMLHTPHIEPCYCYRCPFGRTPADCALECADALHRTVCYEGPDSVAAFIAEPVVGASAGALTPPDGYWKRIREICDHHGILLIADEVMTGAGRTGKPLALDHWGVFADLTVMAKGLSSGYAPLGAVLAKSRIHDAIKAGSGEFVHGFTYCQHPLSMAAGNAVLKYVKENGLIERSARMGALLNQKLKALMELDNVGEVRGLGLFCGVEIVEDKASRKPFAPEKKAAAKIGAECMKRGLVIYPGSGGADGIAGDHILVCPPFVIDEEGIEIIAHTLREALAACL